MAEASPHPADLTPLTPSVGPEPAGGRKRLLITLMKLAVTLVFFAIIAYYVDWQETAAQLRDFPRGLIGVVVFLWLILFFISVIKWDQLLKVHGLKYKFAALSRWYAIGYFYNQLLPSIIGGDGYRIFRTMDNGRHRACAILPVFLERVSGMAALLTMGTIAATVDYALQGGMFSYIAMLVGLIGGSVGCLFLIGLWLTPLHRWIVTWRRCPKVLKVLMEHSAEYLRAPLRCFWAGVISFVFHGTRGLIYWLLLWGLGAEVGFLPILVVLAATTLLSMLPISLGGYGLIEGSFMASMPYYGVTEEAGLSAMLIMRATTLPIAGIGGLLSFWEHRRRDAAVRRMDDTVQGPAVMGARQP